MERIEALAGRLDAARAVLARDDPRRAAILAALHGLNVDALEASLATVGAAESPVAPRPSTTDDAPLLARYGVPTALSAIAIAALTVAWRRRRR